MNPQPEQCPGGKECHCPQRGLLPHLNYPRVPVVVTINGRYQRTISLRWLLARKVDDDADIIIFPGMYLEDVSDDSELSQLTPLGLLVAQALQCEPEFESIVMQAHGVSVDFSPACDWVELERDALGALAAAAGLPAGSLYVKTRLKQRGRTRPTLAADDQVSDTEPPVEG